MFDYVIKIPFNSLGMPMLYRASNLINLFFWSVVSLNRPLTPICVRNGLNRVAGNCRRKPVVVIT
ncbi:hypothetical protein OAI_00380 [Vibrio cyclitrophicus FF160]|nr:hypothetical protein OAI_00380 [Vibrio cyclitrophicus FF160]PMJ21471.1 hypothetical protein BCU28_09835 [Vibrio cyclitrophicus]